MASILIFYDPSKNMGTELFKNNVLLKDAKHFCNLQRTSNKGAGWFCGFTDDDDTRHPDCSVPAISHRLSDVWHNRRR